MTINVTRKRIFSTLGIMLVILGAFAFGFVSSLDLKSATATEERQQYLLKAGDASPSVRAGVLMALRSFQDGYIKRDPRELDTFMSHLFPEDDVLLLGTDGDEWARGYPAVADFIRTDWLKWGDFRFAVDDSIIWTSGDVAWIASVGSVHKLHTDRPVRFSAILTRKGSAWVFRQVHFQWDDRDARPSDLLHPSTQVKLIKLAMRYIHGMALRLWVSPSSNIILGFDSRQLHPTA